MSVEVRLESKNCREWKRRHGGGRNKYGRKGLVNVTVFTCALCGLIRVHMLSAAVCKLMATTIIPNDGPFRGSKMVKRRNSTYCPSRIPVTMEG